MNPLCEESVSEGEHESYIFRSAARKLMLSYRKREITTVGCALGDV